MPAWAVATLQLACGIVIAASIAVLGLWMRTQVVPVDRVASRLLEDGFYFCFYGIFGNGCWQ